MATVDRGDAVDIAELDHKIELRFAELQSSLIRWMVGIFLTFTTLIGALLTAHNILG